MKPFTLEPDTAAPIQTSMRLPVAAPEWYPTIEAIGDGSVNVKSADWYVRFWLTVGGHCETLSAYGADGRKAKGTDKRKITIAARQSLDALIDSLGAV